MSLQELFETHAISQADTAAKIGMSRGTFNNKINPDHPSKFTPAEMVKLCEVLEQKQKAIKEFLTTIQ